MEGAGVGFWGRCFKRSDRTGQLGGVACLFHLGHCCKLLGKDLRSQSVLFCRPSKVTGPVAVYLASEIKMRPEESTQAALIPGTAVWCLCVQII